MLNMGLLAMRLTLAHSKVGQDLVFCPAKWEII